MAWNDRLNSDYIRLISEREGEIRIGQSLKDCSEAQFVLLGVEECVGPLTNNGRSGSEHAFQVFCSKFLNMQFNECLEDRKVGILGRVHVMKEHLLGGEFVSELDDFIFGLLHTHIQRGQIVILIGGGHNNSYPLLRYFSEVNAAQVEVVNLDPHADYRALEGRHSGNAFSYAHQHGFMKSYAVLGLHKAYNNSNMLNQMIEHGHEIYFFENWLDDDQRFDLDLKDCVKSIKKADLIGVELDLDAIEGMPSSAYSPSGVSMSQARKYVRSLARIQNNGYLHLPEGAPNSARENDQIGKTLAYLVHDFISCHRLP